MFTFPFFSPKTRDTFLSSCFLKRSLSASMPWGYATKLLMRNSIAPSIEQHRTQCVQQRMLDRHWNPEPDGARSLPGISQEPMLKHQCAGFEARILLDDLFVHIQQCAVRTLTNGMDTDLPTPAHREVGQSEEVVRVPEQVSPVARIVHIGLVERTSFRPCAGYIVRPFSKETVFSLAFRRCDPSFPALFPGSCSRQEGPGCPDHDDFSVCSPSALGLLSRCGPPSPALLLCVSEAVFRGVGSSTANIRS